MVGDIFPQPRSSSPSNFTGPDRRQLDLPAEVVIDAGQRPNHSGIGRGQIGQGQCVVNRAEMAGVVIGGMCFGWWRFPAGCALSVEALSVGQSAPVAQRVSATRSGVSNVFKVSKVFNLSNVSGLSSVSNGSNVSDVSAETSEVRDTPVL